MPLALALLPAWTPLRITKLALIVQTAPVASVRFVAGGMVEAPLDPPLDELEDDDEELDEELELDELDEDELLDDIGWPVTW